MSPPTNTTWNSERKDTYYTYCRVVPLVVLCLIY